MPPARRLRGISRAAGVALGWGDGRPAVRHRDAAGAAARGDHAADRRGRRRAASSSSAPRCRRSRRSSPPISASATSSASATAPTRSRSRCGRWACAPGDEVVVPSFTFYATAEAVVDLGARPVFCDVDPDTRNVTVETVRAAMTPRTKAIVAVDLFGFRRRSRSCASSGVPVLEDAAQAAGARSAGAWPARSATRRRSRSTRPRTSARFGDGGAIATDDDEVAEIARALRFHGSRDKQTFEYVGYNSRLDELQAAILRVLLPELDGWCDGRRAGAERLRRRRAWPSTSRCRWCPTAPSRPGTCTSSPIRAPIELLAGAERRGRPGARLLPPSPASPAGDGAVHRMTRSRCRRPTSWPPPTSRCRSARCSASRAGPGGRGGDRRRGLRTAIAVRVWVDLTNSPHVLVLRPVIARAACARATRWRSRRGTSPRRWRCASASGSSTRRSGTTAARGCWTRPAVWRPARRS